MVLNVTRFLLNVKSEASIDSRKFENCLVFKRRRRYECTRRGLPSPPADCRANCKASSPQLLRVTGFSQSAQKPLVVPTSGAEVAAIPSSDASRSEYVLRVARLATCSARRRASLRTTDREGNALASPARRHGTSRQVAAEEESRGFLVRIALPTRSRSLPSAPTKTERLAWLARLSLAADVRFSASKSFQDFP